jgi:cysteine desulfurase
VIYFDHSATTPLDAEVLEAMLPYLTTDFGNASSTYRLGQGARQAIDAARDEAARFLNCEPKEIIFTSGGSESDNLALRGVARRSRAKGRHVVISALEHDAVLRTAEALQDEGFGVTLVPPDAAGTVPPEALRAALRPDTILVSIMHSNNEVGTLQPFPELVQVTRAHSQALFHTDAVQSAGKVPLDVRALGVDLLSLSAHKLHGPKGTGLLYVRQGTPLEPQIRGGGHERNRRAGTENVAGIVGFGRAMAVATRDLAANTRHVTSLRDQLIAAVLEGVPDSRLSGHPTHRLPHHASFLFAGVEGESLLVQLDREGICASSGSACTSGSLEPSHVLLAMGVPHREALGSLRLSLGKGSTRAEVERVAEVLPPAVARLRQHAAVGSGP